MAKRKTKEDEQKALEDKRKLRTKQLAQLKASNEMLEEAKADIFRHYGEDSSTAREFIEQIDNAKIDNIDRAREYLNATEEEMESVKYAKVTEAEKKAYYARLERLGKSEEDLMRKNLMEVVPDSTHVRKNGRFDDLLSKFEKLKNITKKKTETVVDTGEASGSDDKSEPEGNTQEQHVPSDAQEKKPEKNDSGENSVTEVHNIDEYHVGDKVEKPYRCIGFDPRDVPEYVQYDIIPLPSKGECYPHKKNCLPVAYLTAADENIIASPNMYNNGNLMDILLERKILDKSVKVSELTKGDRDAIIVWLRATAYGPEYPIIARYNGQEYESSVDLSKLKYMEFNLKGDENGYFDYTTSDGDAIKFKFMTAQEEDDLLQDNKRKFTVINTHDIIDFCTRMLVPIKAVDDEHVDSIVEAVEGIQKWALDIGGNTAEIDKDLVYNNGVTSRMCAYTMSVNGQTDRVYIKNYIENMRSSEAKAYRDYVSRNVPCVDFNVEIQVPESLGGGSFTTFLGLNESIFINIK